MWKKKEQQQNEDEESLTTVPAAAVEPPYSSLELGGSTSYPDTDTWEMWRLTLGFVHNGGRQFLENVSLSSCTWSDGVCLIPI